MVYHNPVKCNDIHYYKKCIKIGCGYSTGTGSVLAPYICMASSHACAVGRVAISQKQSSRRTSKPNGKKLNPSKTI